MRTAECTEVQALAEVLWLRGKIAETTVALRDAVRLQERKRDVASAERLRARAVQFGAEIAANK